MTKESLLKMLSSFHFDALSREPFLCEYENGYGLFYSIKHPEYGKLSRVFASSNSLDYKNFLALYRFYLEHEDEVRVIFDDYRELNPQVSFFYHDERIFLDDIPRIEKIVHLGDKNDVSLQKVLRSARLLEEVILSKIKLQKDCHESVLRFSEEYYTLMKKIGALKHQYNPKYQAENIESISETSFYDFTPDYLTLKCPSLSSIDEEEAKNYVHELLKFLLKIDESVTFIQDKYELLCYPLKIDLAKKQCSYLESLVVKKGKLFSKKENLDEVLSKMEKSHSLSHVISFKNYKNNELKRIEEKYTMIDDIDLFMVGDFLVDFDNLHVEDVPISVKKTPIKMSGSSLIHSLENDYENRSFEEQSILTYYHSMLKPILYYIESCQENIANEYIKDFLHDLKLSSNSVIRLRYFKSILTSGIEDCKKSILDSFGRVHQFLCDELLDDFVVYFKDQKALSNKDYLIASNKRNMAPCQLLGEQDILYVCTLKKGSQVFYIPKEITYDLDQEDAFVVKSGNPYFFIDRKKNTIKGENSDIIRVVEYKGKKLKENGYVVIKDIHSVKVVQIRKIVIERK